MTPHTWYDLLDNYICQVENLKEIIFNKIKKKKISTNSKKEENEEFDKANLQILYTLRVDIYYYILNAYTTAAVYKLALSKISIINKYQYCDHTSMHIHRHTVWFSSFWGV